MVEEGKGIGGFVKDSFEMNCWVNYCFWCCFGNHRDGVLLLLG